MWDHILNRALYTCGSVTHSPPKKSKPFPQNQNQLTRSTSYPHCLAGDTRRRPSPPPPLLPTTFVCLLSHSRVFPSLPLPPRAWSRLRSAFASSPSPGGAPDTAGTRKGFRCYSAALRSPRKSRPVVLPRRFARAAFLEACSAPASRGGSRRASSTASGRRFSS